MTAFDQCWAFLQRPDIEGGATISDDPEDPGGLTRWGISQKAYPLEDIRNLSEARARFLFRRDYWNACQCDQFPEAVAIALADAAFNQGAGTAIRLLQTAVGVPADGVLGPVTRAAVARQPAIALQDFLSHRLVRYAKGSETYRRGWFLRVLRLQETLTI